MTKTPSRPVDGSVRTATATQAGVSRRQTVTSTSAARLLWGPSHAPVRAPGTVPVQVRNRPGSGRFLTTQTNVVCWKYHKPQEATMNRLVLALNALGRALVGDVNGPRQKTLSPLDIHDANGWVYVGDYQLSKADAYSVAVEILRRAK